MHILMPVWLAHSAPGGVRRQAGAGGAGAAGGDDCDRAAAAPMFSVDIQPHGERLATAGQDASVNIWSLSVLQRLAAAEARNGGGGVVAEKAPRPADLQPPPGAHLARITGHSRSCNCVRWSPNGSLLASGGDDSTVLIYERGGAEVRSKAFGGGEEDWLVRKPLRGHNGDVTDVCWSPDGERLASASIDNTIGIWSVRLGQLVTLLKGHTALVKGVAWDPVGRFIASQSDDRTTIVWRTSDWGVEKRLSEPFAGAVYNANSNVYFQRCSWSPCGSQLLTTNGLKEPQCDIAPMFTRASSFKDFIDLVGHRQPVVSTKFSARLYRRQQAAMLSGEGAANGNGNVSPTTAASLPYTCMSLGSKDGWVTVWKAGATRPFVVFREVFDHDVIDVSWGSDGYTFVACSSNGKVLYVSFTSEELGDVVPYEEERQLLADVWRKFGGINGASALVETPTQLTMEKTRRLSSHAAPSPHVRKQENTPAGNSFQHKSPADAARQQQQPLPVTVSAAVLPTSAQAVEPTPPANPALLASQREGKGKSGKRRIIPAAVGSDGGSLPNSQPSPFEVPPPSAPKRGRHDPGTSVGAAGTPQPFAPPVEVKTGRNANAAGNPSGFVPPPPPLYKPSVIGLSMMLLPSEKGGAAVARAIDTQSPPTLLEAKEQHGNSRASGHMVSCSRGEKILWRDYYPLLSPVALLAGSAEKFVAVGTADGMLYLYSATSGRRLLPPIALDSAPHLLEAHTDGERWFALVVSRSGLCSVYDVKAKKLVCARSAAPLLARPVDPKGEVPETEDSATRAETYRSISMGRVTNQGEPLLIFSDSHAFFYSRDLCSWLRVADDTAPNSEFTRGTGDVPARAGLLRSLQASAASSRRAPTLSGMGDLRRSAVETLTHLETMLESSIALSSPEDYRYYLANYATKLATAAEDDVEGSDQRLRELCESLLCFGAKRTEDLLVLGMNSRSLLNDVVLPIVAEQTVMQRLVNEFLESLDASEKRFPSLNCKH